MSYGAEIILYTRRYNKYQCQSAALSYQGAAGGDASWLGALILLAVIVSVEVPCPDASASIHASAEAMLDFRSFGYVLLLVIILLFQSVNLHFSMVVDGCSVVSVHLS
jgi:hypothetical protein